MIQLYVEKYGIDALAYNSEEKRRGRYELCDNPANTQYPVFNQGDPQYEDAYRSTVNWIGTRMEKNDNFPPISLITETGYSHVSIKPELVQAALANDFEKMRELFSFNKNTIVDQQFILTK